MTKISGRRRTPGRRWFFNNQGLSLIEMLIAVGLIGVVGLVLTRYVSNVGAVRSSMTLVSSRDAIARRIHHQIKNLDNIRASAEDASNSGNTALRACLTKGDGAPCTILTPGAQVPFLFSVKVAANRRVLAGPTSGGGIKYTQSGADNCTGSTDKCGAFVAHAYFWANCRTGETSCDQASSIFVRYQVVSTVNGLNGLALPNSPPGANATFKTQATHATRLTIAEAFRQKGATCGDYSQAAGYDSAGNIICKCMIGYDTITDRSGTRCRARATCQNTEIFEGFDAKGLPICAPRVLDCRRVEFDDASGGAPRCPPGGWLSNLNLGTCRTGAATKKASNSEVACDTNEGECCWYRQ